MRDDFQPDERIAKFLEQEDIPVPPFAYFQDLVGSFRRKKRIETICFVAVACILLAIMVLAVLRGRGAAVGVILGLVWLCLPLSLLTILGKERVRHGEN
jgi:hypothetical protein